MIGPTFVTPLDAALVFVGSTAASSFLPPAPGARWGLTFGQDEIPFFGDFRFLAGVGAFAVAALVPWNFAGTKRVATLVGAVSLLALGVSEGARAKLAGTIPFIGIQAPALLTGGTASSEEAEAAVAEAEEAVGE